MKQIRVERPKHRRDRADSEILPRDPRDPDIVRAKALRRAARTPAAQPTRRPSTSTTDRSGSDSLASRAVHKPVNPPPITTRSAAASPRNGARAGGAPG